MIELETRAATCSTPDGRLRELRSQAPNFFSILLEHCRFHGEFPGPGNVLKMSIRGVLLSHDFTLVMFTVSTATLVYHVSIHTTTPTSSSPERKIILFGEKPEVLFYLLEREHIATEHMLRITTTAFLLLPHHRPCVQ